MLSTRPGLCCEMRWDPRFPAVSSIWKPLGFRFLPLPGVCRAQEWGCVPSVLLPVLQGSGTAPGAGTGLRLHWCLPSCAGISPHPLGWEFQHGGSRFAHTAAGRMLLEQDSPHSLQGLPQLGDPSPAAPGRRE